MSHKLQGFKARCAFPCMRTDLYWKKIVVNMMEGGSINSMTMFILRVVFRVQT
jgi:hypothetical protein